MDPSDVLAAQLVATNIIPGAVRTFDFKSMWSRKTEIDYPARDFAEVIAYLKFPLKIDLLSFQKLVELKKKVKN